MGNTHAEGEVNHMTFQEEKEVTGRLEEEEEEEAKAEEEEVTAAHSQEEASGPFLSPISLK